MKRFSAPALLRGLTSLITPHPSRLLPALLLTTLLAPFYGCGGEDGGNTASTTGSLPPELQRMRETSLRARTKLCEILSVCNPAYFTSQGIDLTSCVDSGRSLMDSTLAQDFQQQLKRAGHSECGDLNRIAAAVTPLVEPQERCVNSLVAFQESEFCPYLKVDPPFVGVDDFTFSEAHNVGPCLDYYQVYFSDFSALDSPANCLGEVGGTLAPARKG